MARGKGRNFGSKIAMLALLLSMLVPTDDVALAVVGRLALSAPYLILIWVRGEKKHGRRKRKKRRDIVESLLLSAYTVAFVLLSSLGRGRMLLWGYLGLFALLVITWLAFVLLDRTERKGMDPTLILLMFLLLISATRVYEFRSGFPSLWLGGIIAGVLLALLVTILWVDRSQGIWTRLGIFFLIAVFFSATAVSVTAHLNYLLDDSEPQAVVTTIEDKRRGGGRRHRYRYLVLDLDGERIHMNVSNNEYNRYDVGDEYVLVYYEGAFDEPYFLPGG